MAKMHAVLTVAIGLVLCGALGAAPASAATGSIGGTVKSAASGEGIEGIWVCASSPNFGVSGGCESTDAAGEYTVDGLQPNVYKVAFEEEGRQNYLPQWYPGKPIAEEAQLLQVQSGEAATGIDATLSVGGEITGRVTDVGDGEPIEGIEICASQLDRVTEFGFIPCAQSDADGNYTVWALPTGQFKLEFGPAIFQRGAPNYIRQYYPGKSSWSEGGVLAVTAGATYPGFDAALQKGIGIAGTVTAADGGAVEGGPRICALDAVGEAIVQCTGVEMDGTYWMPGLPFGSYVVSFAVDVEEEPGLILHPDGFVRQYYDGKPSFAAADRLTSAGPAEFSGIDAQLVRGPETGLRPYVPALDSAPAPTYSWGPGPANPKPPLKCRRGSRRKLVGGKRRCVKVHKKHPRTHRPGARGATSGR